MSEPTKYINILREAFQRYYDFIINNGSCNNIFKGDAYSNEIKPYVKILSPKGLLLTTPDGKQITSFEDVKALDKGLFECWPYYTYKELDEKGVVGGKESKIYPSWWINRKEKLVAYFYIQYAAYLERLDELEKLKYSEKQEQSNGQDTISEGFLDNTGCLKIGNKKISFTDSEVGLIRYMAKELLALRQEYLELQHILAYLYKVPGAMNKIRLTKNDRGTFDRDNNRINKRCKKHGIENLIKCLGEKRYTLSIKLELSRNFQNNSQSSPYKPLKY